MDKIWVVTSQSNSSGKPLKVRAKTRLSQRKEPSVSSFDDYMAVRNSCWILEERNGDYFCDCPKGSKGKICKHTVGLLYRNGHLEATSDVRSVRLGQKRKPGRPKKLPMCLVRSPPPAQHQCEGRGGGQPRVSSGQVSSGLEDHLAEVRSR